MRAPFVHALFLAALLPAAAYAQAQPPASLKPAAWIAGCWTVTKGTTTIDEQWMAPAGGIMLGMARTITGGKVEEYELIVLRAVDGRVDYEAHPSFQTPAVFTASHLSDTLLVFQNPRHDFPKVIAYRKAGPDSLVASVAAGTAPGDRTIAFPYHRVACPGTSARH
jgi:hypothetical protein